MKQVQRIILWGTAVYLLINLVSIGLSWCYFGYLDWSVLWEMVLVSLPPVVVALGCYFLLEVEAAPKQQRGIGRKNQRRRYEVLHEKPSH